MDKRLKCDSMCLSDQDNRLNHIKLLSNPSTFGACVVFIFDTEATGVCTAYTRDFIELKM